MAIKEPPKRSAAPTVNEKALATPKRFRISRGVPEPGSKPVSAPPRSAQQPAVTTSMLRHAQRRQIYVLQAGTFVWMTAIGPTSPSASKPLTARQPAMGSSLRHPVTRSSQRSRVAPSCSRRPSIVAKEASVRKRSAAAIYAAADGARMRCGLVRRRSVVAICPAPTQHQGPILACFAVATAQTTEPPRSA